MDEEKILLELDREDAPDVADLINKKRLALAEEIKKRQEELDTLINKDMRLGFALQKLNGGDYSSAKKNGEVVGDKVPRVIPKPAINGYDMNWSIWEKIQFVLRKQIEPISKNEIVDRISEFDPRVNLLFGKKKRSFSVQVLSCLSTKSEKGLLRREGEAGNFKYSLFIE